MMFTPSQIPQSYTQPTDVSSHNSALQLWKIEIVSTVTTFNFIILIGMDILLRLLPDCIYSKRRPRLPAHAAIVLKEVFMENPIL